MDSTQSKTITQVPLLDLQSQYEPIKEEVLAAIKEVFDAKRFIMGEKITKLEEEVANYCGCKHAIGVSSGTDALLVALMALDIGPGDEVITTPFTFFATAGSISRVGAKPVFIDIEKDTYNINPDLIEAKINSNTKAIMPVHLFGQMVDMDQIMAIAKKHNLIVIEDAAQAIGCNYKSSVDGQTKMAGSVGDVGCFSFFPSKNLGCCGDGGIVTTNNDELAEKIRVLRDHGSKPRYYHHTIGGNFRLDAIQAAVLLVKLPYLEDQHQKRQENANYYNSKLQDIIKTPVVRDGYRMIYNQYTIRSSQRDEIQQALLKNKIGNAIYYPIPLHLQPCFAYLGYKEGDCPESEKAAKEVLAIPIYAELDNAQKDYVIETIQAVF